MKFSKVDVEIEKLLLIGLIISGSFIKKILPVFEYEYLDLPDVKTVSKWTIDYYQKYNKAPYAVIQNVFNDKKRNLKEDSIKWIRDFLADLSKDSEKPGFNEEYLFDECVKYFKRQKLLKASAKVQDLLADNKDEQAQQVWLDSMKIPEAGDLGINPFDLSTVKKFFGKEKERVSLTLGIKALDRMVGPAKSGWLAMFMGPMKRGKTFALIHMALRAVVKGYNAVFISLETEELDNAMRVWQNVGSLASQESRLKFPYFEGEDVKHEIHERPRLGAKVAKEAVKLFSKAVESPRLRIKTWPMGTAGVDDFRKYLDMLEVYMHFSPHVILVDYLGIMKPPRGLQGRDVYNVNSIDLKALAQERKAIMFSAHQGTRATLDKINSMGPWDMPEDIRIFGNVDALYGLNQTDKEMDEGIMRINVLGHRHRKFTRSKQAKVLQQFGAGQFVLDDIEIKSPKNREKTKGEEGLQKDGEKDLKQ